MKVTCTIGNLKAAVAAAERFTGKHITLPVLSCLLLSAKENRVFITATNLETGIEYIIPSKVQKSGIAAIPARTFSQILQALEDEIVTLEAKQHHLTIHTSSSNVTIVGLNPTDFPNLPSIKKENSLTIKSTILTQSLGKVLPAAAITDIKPELSGVLLVTAPGSVTLTATDSFRLSEKLIRKADGVSEAVECIIPAKTLQELMRIVPADEEVDVVISIGEHQAVFEWGAVRVISRLVDGAYPPYKNLIPKAYETTIVADRNALLKKIKLASLFSSRLNDVTIQFSQNQLEVTTTNSDTGSTATRIPAKGRGSSTAVMFNYRYLIDGLEAAGGENIVLNLNGTSGPAMVQNPDDSSFLYLVMPIRSA